MCKNEKNKGEHSLMERAGVLSGVIKRRRMLFAEVKLPQVSCSLKSHFRQVAQSS